MIDKIIKVLFIFSSSGLMAVGYFYDDRLSIYDINISVLISVFYILSGILLLLTIRTLRFTIPKTILYAFFILFVLATPLLWINFGYNIYGIQKYVSFSLIVIPTCIIILETFSRKDIHFMIWVLFSISCFLLFLGYQGFDNAKELQGQRMAVMGGGPIVFGRWILVGALILFFSTRFKTRYKFLLIPLFMFMAFAAGSRGPMYAFILVIFLYLFFNFRKHALRIFSLISVSILFFSSIYIFDAMGYETIDIQNRYHELGNPAKRMTNPTVGGYARVDRIKRSTNLIVRYPLGVGTGNWAKETNRFSDLHHRDKEYAHNIVLELINESGLIVGLFFLLLIFSIITSRLGLTYSDTSRICFILFIYMLINAMISGDLMDSRLLFIFLSLYLSYSLKDHQEQYSIK